MPAKRFAQAIVLRKGLTYLAVGAALLLAPEWFFANIGNFPPFNRHYAGDLGSFQLALGAVLLYTARNPVKHASVLGVAALGGTKDTLNHAVDAARGPGGWGQAVGRRRPGRADAGGRVAGGPRAARRYQRSG